MKMQTAFLDATQKGATTAPLSVIRMFAIPVGMITASFVRMEPAAAALAVILGISLLIMANVVVIAINLQAIFKEQSA